MFTGTVATCHYHRPYTERAYHRAERNHRHASLQWWRRPQIAQHPGLVVSSEARDPVVITDEMVTERLQQNPLAYDKDGEMHYDIISAFIKSIRGSDPDGAIYWLARMVEPEKIPHSSPAASSFPLGRRGTGKPERLADCQCVFRRVMKVGWPEGRIPLAEATVYLATSPKSNSAYMAINNALELVRQTGNLPVPLHLRNAPTKLMKQLGYGEIISMRTIIPGTSSSNNFCPTS